MNWITKLERKFGRYCIPNLISILIGGQILVYAVELFVNQYISFYLNLDRGALLAGQIWRVITFMFVPFSGGGPLSVVLGIYFTWFWAKGQTLAMKTWHIRVVDRDGRPLTQRRALLRYVCSWLWFLPPLAALAPFSLPGGEATVIVLGWVAVWAVLSRFHPQQQFWHDALAGTRLVHYEPAKK